MNLNDLKKEIIARGNEHDACGNGITLVRSCKTKVDLLNAITRYWLWCYEYKHIIDDRFILDNFSDKEIKKSRFYFQHEKAEYQSYVRTLPLPEPGWDTILLCGKPVQIARTNLRDDTLADVSPAGVHYFSHENALIAAERQGVRLPSPEEWTSFCDNLSVWDNVNKGRWFRCKSPDGYVDVFMPASGFRDSVSGAFAYTDSYGYAWSCASAGANGYYLSVYSPVVAPTYSNARALGFSVRCVSLNGIK
jgi:hypothetical protein